jgi:toxin ParE1/3/4
MRLIWSPLAVERIEEIADYIASDSPRAADAWVDAVFDRIDLLKRNPEMGRIVPEIQARTIRELVFLNYRIIYRLTRTAIIVLSVRHFKQMLPLDETVPDG